MKLSKYFQLTNTSPLFAINQILISVIFAYINGEVNIMVIGKKHTDRGTKRYKNVGNKIISGEYFTQNLSSHYRIEHH
jgi:hypothetical protein